MTNDFPMFDQAFKLRELTQTAKPAAPAAPVGLPMVVVTGGRAGFGATTVAVNLAAVLADFGERVVLVDAAQQHADLAQVAGVKSRIKYSLQDVVSGTGRAAEALVPGPAGTSLLASGEVRSEKDFSRHAQQRLLAELQTLSKVATLLVVDLGAGLTPWARRFWLRAKLVMLVTTADDSALLDTYSTIKRSESDSIPNEIRLLANQCDTEKIATDVCRRLCGASERFLSRRVPALPALPRHCDPIGASDSEVPRVWEAPNSAFGHAMLWLGRAVSDVLQMGEVTPAQRRDDHEFLPREFSRC
jgi:MinD-like ATPase involved in chromosome partitioning or flagellar assembly